MKRSDLKKIVKECVKEILFEEGVLSSLVAEVAVGITKAQGIVVEAKQPQQDTATLQEAREEEAESRRRKLLETKRKMLDGYTSERVCRASKMAGQGCPISRSAIIMDFRQRIIRIVMQP